MESKTACTFIFFLSIQLFSFAGESRPYSIDGFNLVVVKPNSWTIYREERTETTYQVSFGLPKIWSKTEGQEIENAVSVLALRDESVKSLSDAVKAEFARIEDILVSSEETASSFGKSFIIITKIRGRAYKTRSTILFKNGVSYFIAFTATEGTFDLNLPKYLKFISALEFQE